MMYEAAMTLSELSEKSLSFKKPDINLCMDDFYQVDFLMDKLDIEKPVAEYLIFIYDKTKAFITDNELSQKINDLLYTFGSNIEERSLDNRNESLVVYDLPSTLAMHTLFGPMWANNITNFCIELNSSLEFRAFINAVLPYTLPPHKKYSFTSLYRMLRMFEGSASYNASATNNQNDDQVNELYEFFRELRFSFPLSDDRTSYCPDHGFLKGVTIDSNKPFANTLGADGQYINATNVSEDSSPARCYISCSIYDTTRRSTLEVLIKDKKNNEHNAFVEMIPLLRNVDGASFMTDALNSRPKLFETAIQHNLHPILPIKTNNGNKGLYETMQYCFDDNSLKSDSKTYKKFESPVQMAGNRIESTIIETLSIDSLKEQDIDCFDFEAYKGACTIIKKTKFTSFKCNVFSPKALDKLNKKSAEPSIHFYITDISNDEHGFKQILVSLNEYWICEQAHNVADTEFEQDYLSTSKKSSCVIRVNLIRLAVDAINQFKSNYNSTVTKKSHKLTYERSRRLIKNKLSDRLEYLKLFLNGLFP